ncbi:excalibur calcium-binding domain-containing protein [Aliarcobacter cryaerophilus]|uniref:excalibur calcium-binding domain-containing protein n=1 Tax=Aliarcobacter cryaerophilus TaxID=28198 RepID=UPI003BAE3D73
MKKIFLLILIVSCSLSFANNKENKKNSNNQKEQCKEKKYCKDMKSCKEAIFHLEVCGNKKLDKDRDGIPCENICR